MSMRALSVDFLFYGLLDLAQRSVSLIMVPLYTRVLSQKQYGDLDIMLTMISIFVVLVDLQFVSGFSRLYFEYRRDGRGNGFVGTVLIVRFIAGTAVALGIIVAGTLGYLNWSFIPPFSRNETAWTLVALMVPLTLVYDILLLQTRMLRWKRPFAAGAFSSTVVSCVASVVFVAVWKWGMAGIILGLVAGKIVGLASLGWSVREEVDLRVDRETLGPLLWYTLPLVPGWWLSFGSAYIGRFFVYGVQGADQNAILAISLKIASVIGLYSISFRSAWQPLAMSYIGDSAGEVFYVRSMRLFMAGVLFSALFLAAFLHLILTVLAPGSYSVVELYFPLFAVGTLIGECESNLQLGNQIAKRTHWITISSTLSMTINLAILVTLTSRLGIVAAGLGLAASSLAKSVVTYVSAQRNWWIPYDVRAMVLFGVGCACFLALGACLAVPVIPRWTVRMGMVLLGVGVPLAILDGSDRRFLGTLALNWVPSRRQDVIG